MWFYYRMLEQILYHTFWVHNSRHKNLIRKLCLLHYFIIEQNVAC